MAGPPAGYEEVAAPTQRAGGPPPGYEEVAPPSGASYDAYLKSEAPTRQVRPPMQGQQNFMEQVGSRIKQNVEMIPHMLDAAQLMKGIQQKVAQGADLTPYERTLYTEAQAGGQSAKQLTGAGGSLPSQVLKSAAIVPRMAYQAVKGYIQNPASAVGDIVTMAPELAEMRLPRGKAALGEVPKPVPSAEPPAPSYERPNLTPEQQADFTAQLDKANKPFVEHQQAQDMRAQVQQRAAVVQQDAKALHAQVYGGLSERADAFREASADVTRPINGITDTIEQARKDLSGVPADLRIFNQVMDHLEGHALEPQAEAFAERTGRGMSLEKAGENLPPSAEVPLIDLQRQYTALSNQWADASGNVKRVLGDVRAAYGKELQAGADSIGQGNEWRGLQKDFSNYYRDWRGTGPLAKVLKAPHPDYVAPYVTGKPGNLLRETYAKYGNPQSITDLQGLVNAPPPPPPEIAPPLPAPVKPGPILSHGSRLVGKLVGGTVGSALGHPLIGYGVGSELGTEAAKRIAARRSMPPTPQAYHRTLLDAKEGRISPGEADRRIAAAGGKVRVRPIPQPTE